jgi:hypothetical protein
MLFLRSTALKVAKVTSCASGHDEPLHATIQAFAADRNTHVELGPRCRAIRLRPIDY